MALFHPFQSKEASRGIYRMKWWAHQDSNLGQAGYEPAALTAELWARKPSLTTTFQEGS